MRITKCLAAAVLFVSMSMWAANSPLSLKIAARTSSLKVGDKVIVDIVTTNLSNQVLTYHNTNLCDYSVKVSTSSGNPAPQTPLKKGLDCSGRGLRVTGRDIIVALKPGESDTEELEVTTFYDLSAPGQYSIQVDRTFPTLGHFTSNVVIINVQ